MRVGNRLGRAVILTEKGTVDVNAATQKAFSPSLDEAVSRLDELRNWWHSAATSAPLDAFDASMFHELGPVVQNPSQVFAIGLNYSLTPGRWAWHCPTSHWSSVSSPRA